MRILVTGGTGFLGTSVVKHLLAHGHQIALLTRRECSIPGVDVITGDLSDIEKLAPRLIKWKADACIHLAWYAEPGKYLNSPINTRFLTWSLDLLHVLAAADCRHVVIAGTCAEYDAEFGYLREDGPVRPTTLYAASKLALYLAGRQFAQNEGIRLTWARIFYPYGPGEDPRRAIAGMINALIRNQPFKATEGMQVRDYLHVDDIARAFVSLVEHESEGCFNIASGIPVTMRTIMETAGRIVGRPDLIEFGAAPYREWDPMFICGDSHRLRTQGWTPNQNLYSGLDETIAWWRNQLNPMST